MTRCFDPKFEILPQAQTELWESLRPAAALGFVLYGGTALGLQLGHRQSIDFDFFNASALDKAVIRSTFAFVGASSVLQDSPNTLVVSAPMPSGDVKVSFFGGVAIGRVADPLQTRDDVLLVASMDDLMATKLKAILDRAEAKDYQDIAAMIEAGVSLAKGLSSFRAMFHGEPSTALKALGYFDDGDLGKLKGSERARLRSARDRVLELPEVQLIYGSLSADLGTCKDNEKSPRTGLRQRGF